MAPPITTTDVKKKAASTASPPPSAIACVCIFRWPSGWSTKPLRNATERINGVISKPAATDPKKAAR